MTGKKFVIEIPTTEEDCLVYCKWKIKHPENKKLTWISESGHVTVSLSHKTIACHRFRSQVEFSTSLNYCLLQFYESEKDWKIDEKGLSLTSISRTDGRIYARFSPSRNVALRAQVSEG